MAGRRPVGWGRAAKFGVDDRQYTIEITVDLIVPEPQYAEPIADETAIASSVSFGVGIKIVLPSIHIDDEAMLHAYEIHDAASTRRLAPKMEPSSTP